MVVTAATRRRIRRLVRAAEAAPQPLADTLLRHQRRQSLGRDADAPARCLPLGGGFLASYVVEDWPDGRWRRLTLSHPQERPQVAHLGLLLSLFKFQPILYENVCWLSREGSRGWAFSVAELIVAAEPETEAAVVWDAAADPSDDWEDAEDAA